MKRRLPADSPRRPRPGAGCGQPWGQRLVLLRGRVTGLFLCASECVCYNMVSLTLLTGERCVLIDSKPTGIFNCSARIPLGHFPWI